MSKFFTKTGWLTRYAMACGYIHQSENNNYTVTFSENNRELDTYDLIVCHDMKGRISWDVIEGIGSARKEYVKLCKRHTGGVSRRARKSYEPLDIPSTVYA